MELCGMEENKKSGGGDVRASPFREPANGYKAENEFSPLYPHSLPTVARCARHSHPSPPEKKAASRRKSRLRRKKLRLWLAGLHRVWRSRAVGYRGYRGDSTAWEAEAGACLPYDALLFAAGGFFCSFHATCAPIYRNLEFVDFGAGEDFFVGLQNFIYFWKLKLEMGLSTSAFCPWLAQQQCGYRLIISI